MAANASSFGISIGLDAAICVIILLFFGFFRRTSWTEKFYEPKRYCSLQHSASAAAATQTIERFVFVQSCQDSKRSKQAAQELCRLDCAHIQVQ